MQNENENNENISNILIVDDIPANLKVLGDMLKSDICKVRPVTSGLLALQVAEKEKPDLIILDIVMPDMDGFEVCRQLKANENLCDVPVIFISVLNDTNEIVKALTSGGVDYITKPFQIEEVRARVNTHLKLYKQSKELKEFNATKDKFFSIISHDLTGPFHGFLGYTDLLAQDEGDLTAEQVKSFAKSMNKSANNLYNLLKNLLQWSKMQRGTMSFTPQELSLPKLIADSVETVRVRCEQKSITLINLVKLPIKIIADEQMINSVLLNLLLNAIKFTNKKGEVVVDAHNLSEEIIEISIKDNGIGMDKICIGRLFKIEEKTGTKGTDGELSTGLGLLLCKEFVEKNGGQIRVESEIGKGSTFYFTAKAVI